MARGKRLTVTEKIEKLEIKLTSLENRKKEISSQIRNVKNEIKQLESEKNAEALDTIHRAIVKKNIIKRYTGCLLNDGSSLFFFLYF